MTEHWNQENGRTGFERRERERENERKCKNIIDARNRGAKRRRDKKNELLLK